MEAKPTWEVKRAWADHALRLANLTRNRGARASWFPSTIIPRELRDHGSSEFLNLDTKLRTIQNALVLLPHLEVLMQEEIRLATAREQVKVYEGERALGEDASRNLEWEINFAREQVRGLEQRVERQSAIMLLGVTHLGMVVPTP